MSPRIIPREEWQKKWDEVLTNQETSRKGRGFIIDHTITMELLLDQILASYFTYKDIDLYYKFKELILDKEFFTLHQKIKVFSEMKLHKNPKFNGRYDNFTAKLYDANRIRNKVAHLYDNPHDPGITVKFKGITKKVKLNEEFLKEFGEFMQEIFNDLTEIWSESEVMIRQPPSPT